MCYIHVSAYPSFYSGGILGVIYLPACPFYLSVYMCITLICPGNTLGMIYLPGYIYLCIFPSVYICVSVLGKVWWYSIYPSIYICWADLMWVFYLSTPLYIMKLILWYSTYLHTYLPTYLPTHLSFYLSTIVRGRLQWKAYVSRLLPSMKLFLEYFQLSINPSAYSGSTLRVIYLCIYPRVYLASQYELGGYSTHLLRSVYCWSLSISLPLSTIGVFWEQPINPFDYLSVYLYLCMGSLQWVSYLPPSLSTLE